VKSLGEILFALIFVILSCSAIKAQKTSAPRDSMNIRNPDSTQIVIDTETVPAVIRSRAQELSVLYPLGNFPREETANAGFWARNTGPQYGEVFYSNQFRIYSRFRPSVPLRYYPEHAITHFHFSGDDSVKYPLRLHMLQRQEEPKVNVVYKKGDFALGALSVAMAVDVTDKTHLHLGRESENYVGLYGIDNIDAERYYLAAWHQLSDSTQFIYNTFYSKDRTNWVGGYPNLQKYGSESTSWYQNFLQWKTQRGRTSLDFGLHLGSQRLWLSSERVNENPTELQRGVWFSVDKMISNHLSAGIRYVGEEYRLSGIKVSGASEMRHQMSGELQFENKFFTLEAEAGGRYRSVQNTANDLFGNVKLSFAFAQHSVLGAELKQEVRYTPWQWSLQKNLFVNPFPLNKSTPVTDMSGFLEWQPLQWISLQAAGGTTSFSDWYTLEYLQPAARTDSLLSITRYNGHFSHFNVEVTIKPLKSAEAGIRYDLFPDLNQPLPEIWSQQYVSGWLHAEQFFFKNNLLLHLYSEGGYFTDRQTVGWNPMLQSLTRYPLFRQPQDLGFVHLYFAGEIGPFTLGLSFYNLLHYNLQYAVDQRPQTNIFYLSVRWQFWE